jgi:hypothetical protein
MPRIQVYFSDLEYKKVKDKPAGFIRKAVRLALYREKTSDKERPEKG